MAEKTYWLLVLALLCQAAFAQTNIYHDGWIDFNKNGRMDVFEDPAQPVGLTDATVR